MGIIESRPSTIKSIPLFHRLQYNNQAKTLKETEENNRKKKKLQNGEPCKIKQNSKEFQES